jgi:hypothetical protein
MKSMGKSSPVASHSTGIGGVGYPTEMWPAVPIISLV